MPSNQLAEAASAVNRFGLGARPGAIVGMAEPRGVLAQELRSPPSVQGLFAGLPSSADSLAAEYQFRADRKARKAELEAREAAVKSGDPEAVKKLGDGFFKQFGDQIQAENAARWNAALTAEIGFSERIVRFWSNHFAVSVDKRPTTLLAAPMEREVIRPHAFGRFADLLLGIETHPAMLLYLDNAQSIGPESRLGERLARGGGNPKRKGAQGLNENLGREIMELHTLGVNGGYTQADVIELAKAITGWSVRVPRDDGPGLRGGQTDHANPVTGFVFRENTHEPGARTVLGKRYAEGGMEQGRAVLTDLAVHPSTAKHVCGQLACHFVADKPPQPLVERMVATWLRSGGDLRAVYLSMLESGEAWGPEARKFRTPDDYLIAALRVLGVQQAPDARKLGGLLARMGRPDFTPHSPAGFTDTADAWIGPDPIWKRVQVAEELAAHASRELVPEQIAQNALGPRLHPATAQAVVRADSPQQAVSILFGSPDFQWRI
ncbi:MAG: DUF1800 domain-containing protein [Proteobacteria bacterium]|nr:DUF1800 domain-containing protein [Pseudomonadota bacterium]